MIDNKIHFWMATIKVSFFVPANTENNTPAMAGQRETNILVDTTRKIVTADTLDTMRQTGLLKCQEKYNLDPSTVTDFVIQNISYLGLMSPKEYLANSQLSRIEKK